MAWHAQITGLTLRYLEPPKLAANYDPFEAVVQIVFLERGAVFAHSMLRVTGEPLSVPQWRELGRLLRDEFGIMRVDYDRKGRPSSFDTVRL